MTIVGLTGGIGSGKTTVAKIFNSYGIPVYIADDEAKKLMRRSKVIKRKLIQLFGEKAYENGDLNRKYLADAIFNDKALLGKMNAIVHPKVAKHFNRWVSKQEAPYVLKEVAILFENGGYKACNFIITVTAPITLRFERVVERDHTTRKQVQAIMDNQMSDEEKAKRSDFVIINKSMEATKKQVHDIHQKILNKIQ